MAMSKKPFACPFPGCNMSFTNEDHLTVHKKRHNMVLNLGSMNKNNVFIADKTPTPSRCIKNYEDLTLFQDLQNVNPFDETFRRAVESGKTELSVPDTDISDDTLHTPHIFPHITDCQPANDQIIDAANAIDELSTAPVTTVIDVAKNDLLDSMQNDSFTDENVFRHIEKTSVEIVHEKRLQLVKEPATTKDTKQVLNINGENFELFLKKADGKLMQLAATPISENVESRASAAGSDRDFTTALFSGEKLLTTVIRPNQMVKCLKQSSSSKSSLAKMKLKQILTKEVDQRLGISMGNDKEEDTRATLSKENVGKKQASPVQNTKQEMRERNRASSMRSRAKRKEWIQMLERTISGLNEKNVALLAENKTLHTEIARLKGLLLAHKDCSITKAMKEGKSIYIGSKVINVDPEVIQVAQELPVNTQISVMPSISSIAVKKGQFLTPSSKNPLILPTPEIQTIQIQPNITQEINPIIQMADSDNFMEKKSKNQSTIISDTAIIVDSSLEIVDELENQDC